MNTRTFASTVLAIAIAASCGEKQSAKVVEAKTTPPAPVPVVVPDSSGRGLSFSTNWVDGNVGNWERELADLAGQPNLRYLEIGLFEGRSAIWMFDHILTHETSTMTGIDPFFIEGLEETCRSNLVKAGYLDRTEILKGLSDRELRGLPLESFDLIYVDGSHRADHVLQDAAMCWGLLKQGGILIFDDYRWKGPQRGELSESVDDLRPGIMIDAFLTAFRNSVKVRNKFYQAIVEKVPNPCGDAWDCTPLEDYRYYWTSRTLVHEPSGKDIALSGAEIETLEIFLKTRVLGQVRFDWKGRAAQEPAFLELAKKLKLKSVG